MTSEVPIVDADLFLSKYWQKQSFPMPGATLDNLPNLEPDEVAWLAMQPDVESRLVFTETVDERTSYRLEHGPFSETQLGELPDKNWTILIQDIDKHLPDFRHYFGLVPFIPDWRIDDLMISIAAPGGSVGPHVDNYDVFLVQADGHREWSLGDPASTSADEGAGELSLLNPFEPRESFSASHGDVLYLPPGVPHWGVASSLCTTWSIGMRAPTAQELRAGAERVLDKDFPTGDDERFYVDPDLGSDESEPGMVSAAAVQRIVDQGLLDVALTEAEIALVLGSVATDPKAWLMPEAVSTISRATTFHGMAKVAWYSSDNTKLIFVNGVGRDVSDEALDAFRDACRRRAPSSELLALSGSSEGSDFLEWLRMNGLFDNTSHGK